VTFNEETLFADFSKWFGSDFLYHEDDARERKTGSTFTRTEKEVAHNRIMMDFSLFYIQHCTGKGLAMVEIAKAYHQWCEQNHGPNRTEIEYYFTPVNLFLASLEPPAEGTIPLSK
jgi:hypothetical protein